VMNEVNNQPLLEIHLKRLLESKRITQLLVATTEKPEDNVIVALAGKLKIPVYGGSVEDVLDRFYQAAKPYHPEWIVRLTSDCPLNDPAIVDGVIDKAIHENLDYCSNSLQATFPNGMDVEVFKAHSLEKAWREARLTSDREHVTPYIYNNSTFFGKNDFVSANYENAEDYGGVRLTIDDPEDYKVLRLLIGQLGTDKDWKAYADYYVSHPEIHSLNAHINRNEGYLKSLKKNKRVDGK
jgi:spore coat polysaccharide biosynthesis protein SpsF